MQFTSYFKALFVPLQHILEQLTPDQYSTPQTVLSNASIGQHTRHILELFAELEKGYYSGCVNYDQRERSHWLETDPQAALAALNTLLMQADKPDKHMQVLGNYLVVEGEPLSVHTTYFREVLYNLEHSVHHLAFIRTGLQQYPHITIPSDFGYAPSTTRYRKTCAQ